MYNRVFYALDGGLRHGDGREDLPDDGSIQRRIRHHALQVSGSSVRSLNKIPQFSGGHLLNRLLIPPE